MRRLMLNGENIDSREGLHDRIAAGLHFPEYYGKNLDALYDCLTDMQEDVSIEISAPERMREVLGAYFDVFLLVLSKASAARKNIVIHVDGG